MSPFKIYSFRVGLDLIQIIATTVVAAESMLLELYCAYDELQPIVLDSVRTFPQFDGELYRGKEANRIKRTGKHARKATA